MLIFYLSLALIFFSNFCCATTSVAVPLSPSFDASSALRRIAKRDIQFSNSTSLDTNWDGVTLFNYSPSEDVNESGNTSVSASITVICTTCYIKGNITATLSTDGDFNISQAIRNVTSEIKNDFENITDSTIEFIKDNLTISSLAHDIEHLEFPPIPVDFDISIPSIPEVTLQLQFDGLELYIQIETILSADATYSLNLYTSKIDFVGAGFDEDGVEGFAGLVFTVDLILSVDAAISISSGFHISLEDGAAIDISTFGQNVSHLTFNGGKFEFLPVSIESAGVVISALLRVGAHLGFGLSVDESFNDVPEISFSGGVEGSVFADIAQFVTNVTAGDGGGCDFEVVEEYTLLLGANAGATVALDSHTWGPSPSTQTAVFFTTLLDICGVSGSATIPFSDAITTTTSDAGFFRRADPFPEVVVTATSIGISPRADPSPTATSTGGGFLITTLTTTVTNTATVCLLPLINCPASLQSTPINTATLTTTLTIPAGSSPTFPPITQTIIPTTIPFGTNVKNLDATNGSPTSFTPNATGTGGFSGKVSSEVKSHKGLIIGLAAGIGVPLLIAVVAGCLYCCKRKRSKPANASYQVPQSSGSYPSSLGKKSPAVMVGTPGSLGGQSPNPAGRENRSYFQT